MRFYLNDNIFTENDTYYYERDGKVTKVKGRDWHIRLSDYGWNKLHKNWIIKLNKLSKHKNKNSLFGVLDCGGDGDCLFNCISYAINEDKNINSKELN